MFSNFGLGWLTEMLHPSMERSRRAGLNFAIFSHFWLLPVQENQKNCQKLPFLDLILDWVDIDLWYTPLWKGLCKLRWFLTLLVYLVWYVYFSRRSTSHISSISIQISFCSISKFRFFRKKINTGVLKNEMSSTKVFPIIFDLVSNRATYVE